MSSPLKICRRFAQELFKKLGSDATAFIKSSSLKTYAHLSFETLHSNEDKLVSDELGYKLQAATRYIQDLVLDSYAYFVLGIAPKYLIVFKELDKKKYKQLQSKFARLESRLAAFNLKYSDRIKHFGIFYEGILNYSLEYSPQQDYTVVKNNQRRRLGAHYTPSSLSAVMNGRVLDLLTNESAYKLNSDQLLLLKVCDPSAGAGGILLDYAIQVTEHVVSMQKLIQGQKKRQLPIQALIVRQCLYAHDLDQSALRVCRLSLLALAHGKQIEDKLSLPLNGKSNKRPRQSDLDIDAHQSIYDETWKILHCHVVAHDALQSLEVWQALHPEVFNRKRSGFDLVIGNPPYISMYGRGSQARYFQNSFLERVQRDYGVIDGHSVLSGRLNLFLSFMVLSTHLLNQNAESPSLVALILPDTMITNETYTAMRMGLCLSERLIEVQRHDVDLFKGANVGISVVIWGAQHQGHKVKSLKQAGVNKTDQLTSYLVSLRDLSGETETIVKESHQALIKRTSCSWWPCSSDALNKAQMNGEHSVLLSEHAEIKDGFNTGSANRRQSLLMRLSTTSPQIPKTPELSRFCLEGKWITAFKIKKQPLWIKNIALEQLASAKRFNQQKIVYRQTAPHIIAAVDLEGLVYLNSAHAIMPHEEHEHCLYALCAYLNSEVFKQRYRLLSGETRRTFPQVHISTIKQIRVPKLLFKPNHPDCVKLAELAKSLSKSEQESEQEALLLKLNQYVESIHEQIIK